MPIISKNFSIAGFAENTIKLLVAFVLAVILLSGCDARYKDVSSEAAYSKLIESVCVVKVPLNAYGVTKELVADKKTDTDFIFLADFKYTGPEITFYSSLAARTQLVVKSVQECTNCLDRQVKYIVNVMPEPKQFVGKPVDIDEDVVNRGKVSCK